MTTYSPATLELARCREYLQQSTDECEIEQWIRNSSSLPGLLVAEGFEERSVGVLQRFADCGVKLPGVVIGRYVGDENVNARYRGRFEELAESVAPGRWQIVANHNDGGWVSAGAGLIDASAILLDVSGLSTKGMFGALDAASRLSKKIVIGYTEAEGYWPKRSDWEEMKKDLLEPTKLPETVDNKPWLFGYEHLVELMPGHEGYDSAGSSLALVAFLPFKCARLGAVAGEEDYSHFMFVAGRPRLEKNLWRLEALRDINAPVVRDWPLVEMSTFGYRESLGQLSSLLFSEERLIEKYDIRLAILGSKMQTVACWVLSCIVPSITCIVSVPTKYYQDAFSEGMGCTWAFDLTLP